MLALSLSLLLAVAAPVAAADMPAVAASLVGYPVTITLRDGSVVEGTLIARAAAGYVIATADGTIVSVDDSTLQNLKLRVVTGSVEQRLQAIEQRLTSLENRPAAQPATPPQTKAWTIAVGDSPIIGKAKAPISVVVFSDLQCPFCARLDPTLRALVDDPRFKGELKVVFKHYPLSFHTEARSAARAAIAARSLGGDAAFWAMAARCFQNQKALTTESFSVWARELGLDPAEFERTFAANEQAVTKTIALDGAAAAAVGVRGTPTIFVNGWELRQRSPEGVEALIIDKKLSKTIR